jgi:hypothetical protein
MKIKELKKINPIIKTRSSLNESFPKIKLEGFYQAVENTDILEAVEKIKKEKIKKEKITKP